MSQDEPYVTISEVAKHFSVSNASIRTWVRQGKIPRDTYIKIGTTYRFNISAITEALIKWDGDEEEGEENDGDERAPVQLCFDFSEDQDQDQDQN